MKDNDVVEMDSQFVLRLPPEPSEELRKCLRSGSMSIKDRLYIQLENDTRHGVVHFDNWIFSATMYELPCVIESLKTIDRKTFYKTADVCQILICKEGDECSSPEDTKSAKIDKNSNDKKYQYPDGLTPPLKNVRKRRFRKVLRKKASCEIDVEKEVARLIRIDNEAVNVRWEELFDDDDANKKLSVTDNQDCSMVSSSTGSSQQSTSQIIGVAERDIFGEELSSSDEDCEINVVDSGEDDSNQLTSQIDLEEDKKMLACNRVKAILHRKELHRGGESVEDEIPSSSSQDHAMNIWENTESSNDEPMIVDQEDIAEKRAEIQQQLLDLQARRKAQELKIVSIENQALKQRFQVILNALLDEERDLKGEFEKYQR